MFKQTTQRLYKLLGKTKLEDLPPAWQGPMDRVLNQQEQADPNFKFAEIRYHAEPKVLPLTLPTTTRAIRKTYSRA
ncbi:hypothetical protein N8T08_002202 [Aspergillus melleus]|uniref:Uncharacterized protein n=1 Tax=Aspergillus melleus TaxID=138277 RepID=A0ACC3B960_9EURO|nr:hypothetical protein N8T08_002202 [Aspergillus melleus]